MFDCKQNFYKTVLFDVLIAIHIIRSISFALQLTVKALIERSSISFVVAANLSKIHFKEFIIKKTYLRAIADGERYCYYKRIGEYFLVPKYTHLTANKRSLYPLRRFLVRKVSPDKVLASFTPLCNVHIARCNVCWCTCNGFVVLDLPSRLATYPLTERHVGPKISLLFFISLSFFSLLFLLRTLIYHLFHQLLPQQVATAS